MTFLILLAASCGDDATPADDFQAPAPPTQGVQVSVPAFEVAPYEEIERCLYLKAPTTEDGRVVRIELAARDGLHHAMLAKTPLDLGDGEEVDCFGFPEALMDSYTEVPEPLFASSTQVTAEVVEFPEGVAVELGAGEQLALNYHYINATSEPTTGEVFINLHFADEGAAPDTAHLYVFSNILNISIPANSRHTLTTTCTFPDDAKLLSATPHMHALGVDFSAHHHDGQSTGEALIAGAGWENPETTWFEPPFEVAAGDGLTFSCTWENPGDEDVHFGPEAEDEMCSVFGYYYPGDDLLWRADYSDEDCTIESAVTAR